MMKQLAACIGQYKRPSLLAPFFVTLEVILEVLIPFLMAYVIDMGIERQDLKYIVGIGLLLVVAALLSLMCGALSGKYAAIASSGFAKNLRRQMYYHIQDFSFSNIDKFSTASLVTRLTTDVTNLQNAYQMIIRIAVRCPVMLLFAFVMAFSVNHRLAMIYLGVLPVLAIGLALIIRNVFPIFEWVFKTYDTLNRVVQENLRGIRVVKTFVREAYETEKFTEVSGRIFQKFTKAERLLAMNMPLMQLCMYTCMVCISWFGARMITDGSMTTGQLTSMFSYTTQILMSLMMISMVFVMIIMSKASAERIAEVLSEHSDLVDDRTPVDAVADGSITFDNVSFGYNKTLCLKHIHLQIRSGETIGIIGGTGSSKTSLVQLIPRLYDVTEGSVKVGGVDVRRYSLDTLRNAVAMVLQKNELFSGTIRDNIRWGNLKASDAEIERVCRLAQADGFIQRLPEGYDTFIEQGGTNVSGGQKQRLCIARALLKKPKILILDDSTSAVDTATDARIRKAFREDIPDTTKLIIAQRISSIQDADHILVLDNGCVAAFGTHEELLQSCAVYREVYESQTRGGDADATC